MSNFVGQKSDFTPPVYARYFERTESTPKSSNDHVYFDDDHDNASKAYRAKRDSLFKRLFPAKYANANNDDIEKE